MVREDNDTVVEMYEKLGYEIRGITSLARLIEDQEY